jgi:hypothetical protein
MAISDVWSKNVIMSIENDPDSPYYQYKRNRYKINNLTWNASNSNTEKLFCKPCYSSGLGRLIPSPQPDEKDKLYCRNCGKSYNIFDIDNQQKETKLGMKHGETQDTPILKSQKSKAAKPRKQIGSVNDVLSDEDLSDLRKSGINVS